MRSDFTPPTSTIPFSTRAAPAICCWMGPKSACASPPSFASVTRITPPPRACPRPRSVTGSRMTRGARADALAPPCSRPVRPRLLHALVDRFPADVLQEGIEVLRPLGREVVAHEGVLPPVHHEDGVKADRQDRKSTRLNFSHVKISYAVFCL